MLTQSYWKNTHDYRSPVFNSKINLIMKWLWFTRVQSNNLREWIQWLFHSAVSLKLILFFNYQTRHTYWKQKYIFSFAVVSRKEVANKWWHVQVRITNLACFEIENTLAAQWYWMNSLISLEKDCAAVTCIFFCAVESSR